MERVTFALNQPLLRSGSRLHTARTNLLDASIKGKRCKFVRWRFEIWYDLY